MYIYIYYGDLPCFVASTDRHLKSCCNSRANSQLPSEAWRCAWMKQPGIWVKTNTGGWASEIHFSPVENGGNNIQKWLVYLKIPLKYQLIGGKHPIILFGFQPSFWWCRISLAHPQYVLMFAPKIPEIEWNEWKKWKHDKHLQHPDLFPNGSQWPCSIVSGHCMKSCCRFLRGQETINLVDSEWIGVAQKKVYSAAIIHKPETRLFGDVDPNPKNNFRCDVAMWGRYN